jgi:hypothetical protein
MILIADCARSVRARSIKGLKTASFPLLASATALLAGCAGLGAGPSGPQYRCEHGITFSARFADNSAVLTGSGGQDVLYRDAGGQGPQQTVYSNPRLRVEFGLGASGREAILRYPLLPLVARCVRD